MDKKPRPWSKSPRAPHQGLTSTYRTVGRWADAAAQAALEGNQPALNHAQDKLNEAVIIAHHRMGIPDRFGTPPPTNTLLEHCSRNTLKQLSSTELQDMLDQNLTTDPLAELVLTRELIRRGELTEQDNPTNESDALMLIGTPKPPQHLTDTTPTPWRGKDRFATAGRNGYPATYHEILITYGQGGEACDNNHPIANCPHTPDPEAVSSQKEKANFLAGVWRAGWRFRRQQILTAQIAAGHAERFTNT